MLIKKGTNVYLKGDKFLTHIDGQVTEYASGLFYSQLGERVAYYGKAIKGNEIYFFGGYWDNASHDTIYKINLTTKVVSQSGRLANAEQNASAIFVGDNAYIFKGSNYYIYTGSVVAQQGTQPMTDFQAHCSNGSIIYSMYKKVQMYDTETDTFTSTNLTTNTNCNSAIFYEGKVYGFTNNKVYIYDTINGTLTSKDLPVATQYGWKCALIGSDVFLFEYRSSYNNATDFENNATKKIYRYSLTSGNMWQLQAESPNLYGNMDIIGNGTEVFYLPQQRFSAVNLTAYTDKMYVFKVI